MALTSDKQELILDSPVFDFNGYRRRQTSRRLTVLSLALLFVVFFCFVCMGFWFVSNRAYVRPLNIFLITSKNESVIAKIVSDPDVYSLKTTHGKSEPTVSETIEDVLPTKNILCSHVTDLEKFDCFPNGTVTEKQCVDLGCCYQEVKYDGNYFNESYFPPLGTPYCYYSPDYTGYRIKSVLAIDKLLDISAKLERLTPSGFPNDIQHLDLTIKSIDENTLRIKLTDSDKPRHEAPLNEAVSVKNVSKVELAYDAQLYLNGTLVVLRKSTKSVIFETELSRLVYADQFLQLSTRLPTQFIYGLGEHYDHLLKDVNWTRTPLFNRDNWPRAEVLLYGSHPFYLGMEQDSSSYGVFLLNSNSMDVVLQPTPALTFRPIGGVLDLFVFLGPSPTKVIQQYTAIISKPFLPPYWSLGFHLCRYEYNSLNETRKVWQRTRDAGIPFDTQWNDIDYMKDHNDFTYDPVNFEGLPQFIEELHNASMQYVIIIDPGITNTEEKGTYAPYDEGIDMDVFVRNSSGDIFIGKVWNPVSTVFPDFSHPNATAYWSNQFQQFHDVVPFDGAWIDMNEPSNFYDGQVDGCPDTSLDNPPYVPGGLEPLRTHTLCMSAKHYNNTHYNEHSLYAYREAIATYAAMSRTTSKRPFIISRASFPGQGMWSGHWSGDIGSTWEDMRYSVYDLLKFSLYGMPMMGSDICGFRLDTTVELCARWSALGAFYPFSRNHNDRTQKDQDPVALGDVVVAAAKNTLTTRYQLLPYLYYLFYKSHINGDTVARPLLFEFPEDPNTYGIDEQFLWGPALMIMPALYPGVKTIDVYFPKDIWYDFYTGEKLPFSGVKATLDAPMDSINLAFRGGHVIPQQHSSTTTAESRKNEFFLLVGADAKMQAYGELYWDDGITIGSAEESLFNLIAFQLIDDQFNSTVENIGYEADMVLDYVKICGLDAPGPQSVEVDDRDVTFEFDKYNCLRVNANVTLLENFIISWK